jgi:xanthine dehydrogenase accessory factor
LGRLLWSGSPVPNTGTPGEVGGRGAERVLRAPADGNVAWEVAIGDEVEEGQRLGIVEGASINAPFSGVVRGLISDRVGLTTGLKIGDVDPRRDPSAYNEISDKALAIGGGVVEAVLTWLNR